MLGPKPHGAIAEDPLPRRMVRDAETVKRSLHMGKGEREAVAQHVASAGGAFAMATLMRLPAIV